MIIEYLYINHSMGEFNFNKIETGNFVVHNVFATGFDYEIRILATNIRSNQQYPSNSVKNFVSIFLLLGEPDF